MHMQVFEKLGPSLYDFLRRNEYQPLPLALVQVRRANRLRCMCTIRLVVCISMHVRVALASLQHYSNILAVCRACACWRGWL